VTGVVQIVGTIMFGGAPTSRSSFLTLFFLLILLFFQIYCCVDCPYRILVYHTYILYVTHNRMHIMKIHWTCLESRTAGGLDLQEPWNQSSITRWWLWKWFEMTKVLEVQASNAIEIIF
jgi:hypothetical protein